MTTTVDPPRVRPGAHTFLRPSPLSQLPGVLSLITGKSRIVVLPPKWTGEPVTACRCKGLLVHIEQEWRHSDTCLSCYTAAADAGPCTERHSGCSQPDPLDCQHRCGASVGLADRCAWDSDQLSCCGCCWNLDDIQDLDGVPLKLR